MTSKQFEPFPQGSSSLPLLVRMPDGERHQVDVPTNSSVKDLKSSIAANLAAWTSSALPSASNDANMPSLPPNSLAGWDLDFGGSVLQDSRSLNDYNIPDVYDHASGLLRTITESAHTDAGKKVEALDKACAVVQGISRGEKDMERLISSVFDDDITADETDQPLLGTMKRRGRSKIPTLNFSALTPLAPLGSTSSPKTGRLTAPPTPSQLIRRLSTRRPDLYDPAVADKVDPSQSADLKKQSSWFTAAVALGTDNPFGTSSGTAANTSGAPGSGGGGTGGGSATDVQAGNVSSAAAAGSGELKRGSTWFNDVINVFGNTMSPTAKVNYIGDGDSEGDERENGDDVEGDSEDDEDQNEEEEINHSKDFKSEPSLQNMEDNRVGQNKHRSANQAGAGMQNMSETMNAAVNAAAAVAASVNAQNNDAAKLGEVGNNKATGIPAGVKTEKSNAIVTSRNPMSAPMTSNALSNGGGSENDNSRNGLPPESERQVIGLEPEQSSLGEDIKIPKKRGRKRKNPHLSEKERKEQRQAQNRESAKLSRIRRKKMTVEYEKRVTTLEGENENLRDTVTALTDRLQILQNLLTISVQKRPVPQQALQQHMSGVQNTQSLMPSVSSSLNPTIGLSTGMSLNAPTSLAAQLQQQSGLNQQTGLGTQKSMPSQPHHLTNLNMGYKNF